jgi:predicted nucleic acid-binding protein
MRWWLTQLPEAEAAHRFLHDVLPNGGIVLSALDTLESAILDLLAADLGAFALDQRIGALLNDDVHTLLDMLLSARLLQYTRHQMLNRPAFLLASSEGIPFPDALQIALAEAFNLPLLLADAGTRDRLHVVMADRPRLNVIWLPSYLERS